MNDPRPEMGLEEVIAGIERIAALNEQAGNGHDTYSEVARDLTSYAAALRRHIALDEARERDDSPSIQDCPHCGYRRPAARLTTTEREALTEAISFLSRDAIMMRAGPEADLVPQVERYRETIRAMLQEKP